MNVYSIDVTICATAYIKASSEAEAMEKAKALSGESPTILDHDGGIPLSGLPLDDPALPAISLSPAMTIHQPWHDAGPELVEENVSDELDEDTAQGAAELEGWRGATAQEIKDGFWRFQNETDGTQSEATSWAELCRQEGISCA